MIVIYLLTLFLLGIYSYSQIDLNLTLLQNPWFLSFQKQMINLGYFQRQTSLVIFLVLLFLLFIFYILFIREAERLSSKQIIILLIGISMLSLFSYPAFSHDVFNYIFDARILVVHHANPYTSTALMFSGDTWTRFMNWTHRAYPYGPTFLPLTIPVYLLGLGKFTLTLFWFKALMVGAYLGSCYFLYRLGKTRALVLFALNPLILIEAVVSSHMDVIMLFFALWAYYLLIKNKKVLSGLTLLMSAGIKYATVLFFPIFFWPKIKPQAQLWGIVLAGYFGAILQAGTHEVLPHYLIVPLGFAALLKNKFMTIFGIALSVSLLLIRYYSFLVSGVWTTIKIWPF